MNLNKIRDLYVETFSLKTYAELNYTAFYKIIKKYDKTMGEKNLDNWMNHIATQIFTTSKEPGVLIEIIQSLVSRDKLLEWEKYALGTSLAHSFTYSHSHYYSKLSSQLCRTTGQ